MIAWPQSANAAGGHTGVSSVHLLDVEDVNGNAYYWATRKVTAPSVIGAPASSEYLPWILAVPQITWNRSLATDVGTIVLQNLSGNSLERDFERIVRATALEGALVVYREWNAGGEFAEIEFHATMSVDDSDPERVSITLGQLNDPSKIIAPHRVLCEICQWRWQSVMCGSTEATECDHTFDTCQVPARQFLILNNFEKNYGEAWAKTSTSTFNRVRQY